MHTVVAALADTRADERLAVAEVGIEPLPPLPVGVHLHRVPPLGGKLEANHAGGGVVGREAVAESQALWERSHAVDPRAKQREDGATVGEVVVVVLAVRIVPHRRAIQEDEAGEREDREEQGVAKAQPLPRAPEQRRASTRGARTRRIRGEPDVWRGGRAHGVPRGGLMARRAAGQAAASAARRTGDQPRRQMQRRRSVHARRRARATPAGCDSSWRRSPTAPRPPA